MGDEIETEQDRLFDERADENPIIVKHSVVTTTCRRVTKLVLILGLPVLVLVLVILIFLQGPKNNNGDRNNVPGEQLPIICETTEVSPMIQTKCGCLVGTWTDTRVSTKKVAQFKSIPYALPPKSERRWRPPEPYQLGKCLTKQVLYYNKYRSFCPQNAPQFSEVGFDEDCLHLSVTLPDNFVGKQSTYPVVVYIHGGSSIQGSGIWEHWENYVADYQGFIVVTINYRLNVLGYLALKELSDEQNGFSGNYGIQDQILALKWVQNNIQDFNGDPGKVTVIGQSSGGTSIFALLSSPKAVGLFRSAISLSGSPNITMNLEAAEKQNEDIVRTVGCGYAKNTAAVLSCLRSKTASDIVDATPASWWVSEAFDIQNLDFEGRNFAGMVIVDGQTVTMPFQEAISVGLHRDVSIILGGTGQECDWIPALHLENYDLTLWNDLLNKSLETWPNKEVAMHTINDIYASAMLTVGFQYAFESFNADYSIHCANLEISRNADSNLQVYVFINQWAPSRPVANLYSSPTTWRKNAFHTWDYMAVLDAWEGIYVTEKTSVKYQPNQADHRLGVLMRKHWNSLIVNGTLNEEFNWPPISETTGVYVYSRGDRFPFRESGLWKGYKYDTCQRLHELGFDSKFWWVN